MAANSVLARMAVQISANNADFGKALNATRNDLRNFTGQITKIAGTLGVAFSVQQVASFAFEVSKLAGQAEGVKAAFDLLPNSTKLMVDLKEATGNTVSELELMKRAVQASNFDIELAALPKLLQFATLRAQQTGQSVDYLVDSIVTGIGRKSKLILDNLGISAVALGEKLKGVSTDAASVGDVARAVGQIAEESLANMAGFSDNASTKVQRLEASFENLKVAIGNAANGTGILGTAIDKLGDNIDVLASDNIDGYLKALNLMTFGSVTQQLKLMDQLKTQIKVRQEQKKQEQVIREVDTAFKEFNGNIESYAKAISTHIYKTELLAEFQKRLTQAQEESIPTLEELKQKQKELNEQFELTDLNDSKKLNNLGAEIIAVQKLIDKYEALRKAQKDKGKLVDPATDTATLSDRGLFTGSTDPNNPMRTSPFSNKYFDPEIKTSDWTEESNAALRSYQEELNKTADVAQYVGDSIGNAFQYAGEGQKGFVKALSGITKDIVSLYLRQSIAAMIAASIKDPTTPLPVAKIAAAAFGIAAINAMFSKIGAGSRGGSSDNVSKASRIQYAHTGERDVMFDITLNVDGQGVKTAIDRIDRRNGRTGRG